MTNEAFDETCQALQRFCQRLAGAIQECIIEPLCRLFRSQQWRQFVLHLGKVARHIADRLGLDLRTKPPVRRKQRSTKRAMIYQRKLGLG
jgi:hypothetical protein